MMLPTVVLLGDQLPGAELADALSVRTGTIVLLDGSSPRSGRVLSSKAPVTRLEHLSLATDELLRAYGGADSVIACLDGWEEPGLAASGPFAALRVLVSLFVHGHGGTLVLVTCSNTNMERHRIARAAATLRGVVRARALRLRIIVVKVEQSAGGVAVDGDELATQLAAVLLDPNAIEDDEIALEPGRKP